jgi:hypothetical protein
MSIRKTECSVRDTATLSSEASLAERHHSPASLAVASAGKWPMRSDPPVAPKPPTDHPASPRLGRLKAGQASDAPHAAVMTKKFYTRLANMWFVEDAGFVGTSVELRSGLSRPYFLAVRQDVPEL